MRKLTVPSGRGGTCEFVECPETFCPNCGNKGLWDDQMDDYYAGSGYWCLACGCRSHLDSHDIKDKDDLSQLEALRKIIKG